MRWLSLGASVGLLAIGFLAFPAPPPPLGFAIFMLGLLLLFDWSWEFAAWGGLETRSKEVAIDFYRLDNAKWRYLLAIVIAGVNGAVAATSASEKARAVVLIGSVTLFGLYGLIDIFRSRKRVSRRS